jgi:uncharacterized protein YecT (DUF1311 family)
MALLAIAAGSAPAPASGNVDCDQSPYWSSQQECTGVRLGAAEQELEIVYAAALAYAAKLDGDNAGDYDDPSPDYRAKTYLVESQAAWKQYRDRTCHLDYFKDPGTLSRVAEGECLLALTKARIRGLKAFMEQ